MIENNAKLFTDPKTDYPRLSAALDFSDYIGQCTTLIRNTRLDLQADAEHIITANAPFEFTPPNHRTTNSKVKYGALLIHGLLDSAFTMRDLGIALQTSGLFVRAVLLPGHGTVPGALLSVDFTQWVETVRYAAQALAKEVEHLFLVGYSTGGTLALYQALTAPQRIAGVILLAPALKIHSAFDFLAQWPAAFSNRWPRLGWFHIDKYETRDCVKYRSIPFNAVHQVYRIAKAVKALEPPSCPVFLTLPMADTTVLSQASIDYFLSAPHPMNRLVLYSNKPVRYQEDTRIILRPSCYPELNIVDFSHIALPIQPDNPYYGKNGTYFEASHVEEKTSCLYGEYEGPAKALRNAFFRLKLTNHAYQRLSFNPDFAYLSDQIKQFILQSTEAP